LFPSSTFSQQYCITCVHLEPSTPYEALSANKDIKGATPYDTAPSVEWFERERKG